MVDYIFFGEAFRWSPEAILDLPWSMRKEIKEIYIDVLKKRSDEARSQR